MKTGTRTGLILVVWVALGLTAAPAGAASIFFKSSMTEDQEVPPVVSAVPSFGTYTMTLKDDGSGDFEFKLSLSSIENALTAGHIHPGAAGVVGVPVQDLFDLTSLPFEIIGDNLVLSASLMFSDPSVEDGLRACDALGIGTICDFYVNVHTVAFPGGEIRGQLEVVPEPSTFLLLLSGLSAAAVLRGRSGKTL